jgi:hypothetical protein
MNRLLTIVAATAVAAAIAAAITIPAGADDTPNDNGAQINACLRTHGADVPADLRGLALKQWIAAHMSDPAIAACMPAEPTTKPAPEKLIRCLRDHGLNPPSNIEDLKPYMASQEDTQAGREALTVCGIGTATKAAPGDCGAAKGPDPQAEAAKHAAASRE